MAPGTRHCASCACDIDDDAMDTIEATAAAIVQLKEQIAEKVKALSRIMQKRNQLPPVGRLFPELLSEIFLYYRDAQTPPTSEYLERLPWLPVIHTCKHWRDVVLEDVRFWSTPNLRFPLFVHHFADRYGAAPALSVMLSEPDSDYEDDHETIEILKKGLYAVHRNGNPIVALDLHSHAAHELVQCMHRLLPHAASHVRSIHFGAGPGQYEPVPLDFHYLEIADFLPELQVLSLHTVEFLWPSFLNSCMGSLRELTLTNCGFESSKMETLARIPHLKKLVFRSTGYFYLSEESEPLIPVVFPVLAELHFIDEDAEYCVSLLELFRLPAGCYTSIMPSTRTAISLEEVVECMAAPNVSAVRVIIDDDGFELQCELPTRVKYSMQLPDGVAYGARKALRTFARVFKWKPAALEVSVTKGHSINAEDLALLSAKSVHTLIICGQGEFLAALAECLCMQQRFLPHLARLEVHDADFTQLEPIAIHKWMNARWSRSEVLNVVMEECRGVPPESEEGEKEKELLDVNWLFG